MIYSQENFLSELERVRIRNTVLALRSKWKMVTKPESIGYLSASQKQNTHFFTLGDSAYCMEKDSIPKDAIDLNVRKILLREFSWLYDKVLKNATEVTGAKTILHPDFTVPGFHISRVPVPYTPEFYHQDKSILAYDDEADMESVYSILLLIEKPKRGAWLDYQVGIQNKIKHYKYGYYYSWKSTMPHRIGGFQSDMGEQRITFQCHYYYNERLKANLVYF